ncbi:putative phosphoesterase [Vairimorpha necatrix]|uniref:Phosphoesterase n=1 Tax=Vairimorpha necatrix TaxID=6039 RepID=A0AAX4JF23_9MICR
MVNIKYKFENWIDRETHNVQKFEENEKEPGLYSQLKAFKNVKGLDFYIVFTKIKSVETVIILDYPYIETLSDELKLKKIEYKGMTYYIMEKNVKRKMLLRKISEVITRKENLIF